MGTTPSQVRSWQEMREWQAGLPERSTGRSLESWNEQIRREAPHDERGLRAWLGERGVTGYRQMLLVHERFGYPDFFTKTADETHPTRPACRRPAAGSAARSRSRWACAASTTSTTR